MTIEELIAQVKESAAKHGLSSLGVRPRLSFLLKAVECRGEGLQFFIALMRGNYFAIRIVNSRAGMLRTRGFLSIDEALRFVSRVAFAPWFSLKEIVSQVQMSIAKHDVAVGERGHVYANYERGFESALWFAVRFSRYAYVYLSINRNNTADVDVVLPKYDSKWFESIEVAFAWLAEFKKTHVVTP